MEITIKNLATHETKKYSLKRFLIVLSIFIVYTLYLVIRFGGNGFGLAVLTWTAFVMATPIPDGGLLLDFPVRLLTGLRMVFSEIFVWLVAISTNLYFLFSKPEIYSKTTVTHVFYQILINPWPDWLIIIISLSGTFLSLYFGDELLDIIFFHQRKKYQKGKYYYYIIVILFIVFIFYFLYRYFLSFFGLKI